MKSYYNKILCGLSILLVFFGCTELEVMNQNDPDKSDALQSSSDVESLISGSFRTYWFGTEHWTPLLGLSVVADEATSSWGNAAMKDLSSEPRTTFDNATSYMDIAHINTPWYELYSAISSVNDGLSVILDSNNPVAIGTDGADTKRAVAFGRFIQGISYCYLGAFFDQAYIVDENTDVETTTLNLYPYSDVMDAGINFLTEAIAVIDTNSFDIPDTWINGVTLNQDDLKRLCHSYIARYTACVARSPEERATVDWSAVITHINSAGWTSSDQNFGAWGDGYVSWYSDGRWVNANDGWQRADYKTIGLTDTSGGYQNWLDTDVADRVEFDLYATDRRITGATAHPDSAGSYFSYAGPSYFRSDRGTYHFSKYYHTRYTDYNATETEFMPILTFAEMRLLEAEAEYRLGNTSTASVIVNETRVTNGDLAALDGSESDFFKWLKYEKKIETFLMASGLAFFDRRGWTGDLGTGQSTDLVQGTPVHFPVPAQDLELGGIANYSHGGITGDFAPRIRSHHPSHLRKK